MLSFNVFQYSLAKNIKKEKCSKYFFLTKYIERERTQKLQFHPVRSEFGESEPGSTIMYCSIFIIYIAALCVLLSTLDWFSFTWAVQHQDYDDDQNRVFQN